MKMRALLPLGFLLYFLRDSDAGSFNNNPGTVNIHENIDDEYTVWSNIDATCTVTDSCLTYTCQYYWGWGGWLGLSYSQYCRTVAVYYACNKNVQCNSCKVTSNSMFYASGKNIVKRACTDRGCGPTCSARYCMDAGDSHTIGVECWHSGYSLGNGAISTTFKVSVTANSAPSIWLHSGASVTISKDTYGKDSYVNRIRYSDPDGGTGNDFIKYTVEDTSKFIAWDYSTRTDKLFYLNTENGYLYVNKDLSTEYSYTYTGIKLCVADRRSTWQCTSLTITLVACYEIPTCNDLGPQTFSDQHGIGSTLFTLTYPSPSLHFPNFRSNWLQLEWTLVSSDLNVAMVDRLGGVLKTSGNITVWPSYPSRNYYATIQVGNSESCGRTTTCRMTFTVTFTNWPISFVNLPNSMTQHENFDGEFRLIQIVTYDYNNPDHDNVTCEITSFTPYETNMFELRQDGRYDYNCLMQNTHYASRVINRNRCFLNQAIPVQLATSKGHSWGSSFVKQCNWVPKKPSWNIHRLACQQPQCEFDCPKNIGCFTYGTTANNKFDINIKCKDFYGSEVSSTFTLNLEDNTPPSFTSANEAVVYVDKATHGKDSYVTQAYVSNPDSGYDNDYIRYWVTDENKFIAWDYPNVTRTEKLFYLNEATGYLYVASDLSMEYSYTFEGIEICIRDRRDTDICRSLTVVLTACYEIPTCYDQEYLDFWDTHLPGDTLFDMKFPTPVYHFPTQFRSDWLDLTWTIDDTDLDVAEIVQVEPNDGILRTSGNITVWPSWRYRDYYAIMRVSNTESCGRTTTCVMTFRIWFKNWPIRFISLPDSMYVHENVDDEFLVHSIVTYDYNNPAHDNVTCRMSFSPHEDNLFELRHDGGFKFDSWSIWRLPCQYPKCEFECPLDSGCFTYDIHPQYVFTVTCDDAYDSSVTDYFTLYIEDNSPPYLTPANEATVYISKETHTKDSFVTRIFAEDNDLNVDDDYIRWNITDDTKLIAWDYPNVTRIDRLFYLNGLTGYLYVAADLSMEYSYVFRGIEICIADRRDSWICRDLTIVMTACYEIPTCYDQEFLDFWDTHPVGDTLFTMMYPTPTYHFPVDFRTDWQDLTWSLDESDLDVAAVIQDETRGINEGLMNTVNNITVWPSWRYRDYYAIIRVNNVESCGRETTCVMTFRIWFKNWPIRFISLPADMTVFEDNNDYFVVHEIITYDYNNHLHDNVTCEMSFVPHEDNLFELRHDGNFDYNSWSIHRLPCTEPTCGFHCDKGIGCFTYNTTLNQEFVFTVHCWDAYDTDVTDYFTLHLDYNRAPTFTNLPNTITLNSDKVADRDILYSIQYSDEENENFHYNYSISPNNGVWNEKLIFECDEFGNYYNDRANITSTVYYHEMPESTYYIYICGTERRNMICETLTVHIKDNCPTNPTCSGDSKTLSDTTTVGTSLFTISFQQDATSDGTPTFSFISPTPSYFHVDQASGEITLAKTLKATYPSKTYQLTAFVYDSNACNYGSCQFTVTSTFTNYPIIILNLPYTYLDLPEDTEENEALIVISTSDGNTDDTVTCSRKDITSSYTTNPISQDLFRVTQTYSGSNVWFIENRELPDFTAAILEYEISVECHDKYGSTAEATLTVTIKPNETPSFTNLDDITSIIVDPSIDGKDSIIYAVSTSDVEKDELTFTSEVDHSFVPLALSDAGLVYLRRDVSIEDEDGFSYSIKICVNDTKHNLQPEVCGILNVTFISSQKYPVISNLPDSISFPEDTAGATEIFDVDVDDENLDSVHTFTMTVEPSEATSMFSLHAPTGVLSLQPTKSFNYEERDTYTFTFAVRDQYLKGLEKKKLVLNITNVNEEPTIAITTQGVVFDEDTVPGVVLAKSVASCSDVDKSDAHTFSIENSAYSTYFRMNETTSELTLDQEWDLEASLPISTVLNIICTDAGGLTSKKPISVSVAAVNEYDPVISPTTMSISISSETTVVDTLGEITSVVDEDFGDDGNFHYAIVGVGLGSMHFTVIQTGLLRVKEKITLKSDKVFEFTISVSDGDQTPTARTAYCKVTANYTAPPEEIPEEPTYCTTCTTEGKVVVGAFVVEGVILCVIIIQVIHHVVTVSAQAAATAASTVANVGTGAANAGANTAVNSTAQPQQQLQQQTNTQQNNQQNNQDNNDNRDNNNDNDDDESISDDSDIDERLRPNQTLQPGNQPFPSGIDAAQVGGQVPTFGAWNYA